MRWIAVSFLAIACFAQAQEHELNFTAEPQTFPLWEHGAPGAMGTSDQDTPTITVYLPLEAARSGTAILIAPGGSYTMLASNHEGRQFANLFNGMGVTAFVLKYRLGPRYHHPIELEDAQRAIRWVREHAEQYGYQPDRIGMMGFSAGGHLASTVATHFDGGNTGAADPIDHAGSRPDFVILGYPVITFELPYGNVGSAKNLLGDHPDPKLVQELSNELHVTAQTPPTFIFQTNADTTVPAENSVYYYLALRKAGVQAEMHIFQRGPHGVGLGGDDFSLAEWPALLTNWLRVNSFLK